MLKALNGMVLKRFNKINGKNKNRHANKKIENSQGRSFKDKSPVAGVIERGGELRAKQVPDTKGFNLKSFIVKNISFGVRFAINLVLNIQLRLPMLKLLS